MPSEGPERGQSPPPERQTGKQQRDVAGSGTGVDDASNKDQINKSGLEVRLRVFNDYVHVVELSLTLLPEPHIQPQGSPRR